MAADWITIQQAAALLGRTPEEVSTSLDQDEVETLSVGDVSGAIRLVPKEYVDRELEAQTDEAGVEPAPSGGPVQAQKVEAETVEAGGEDEGPPMHQLTQVITDRYEAIVEAIHRSESTEVIERNLVQLKEAFDLTTEAIRHMRDIQAQTAVSFEDTLGHQNQVMQNLLTSLQSADRNTAAVTEYQQDFIDAIRTLPEPLQSIQDVQLGLIELEEKRQALEKEKTRFEETDFGRMLTMVLYFLLVALLAGMLSVGWTAMKQLPDLLERFQSYPARSLSLELLRLFC